MALEERANAGLHAHAAARAMAERPARETRVLDVGCGSGALLHRLREAGYGALTGVDIAPPPDQPGLQFLACDLDAGRLPLSDASIDLALAVEVLEHVENLGALLHELARVLAPGGVMLLTTPNLHSLEARLRLLLLNRLKQFDAIGDPTHVTPLFLFPLDRLLRRHGLQRLQAWGFPLDGSSPTSRGGLRAAARALRLLGLRGAPDGDQLCLLVGHAPAVPMAADKGRALTAHYAPAPGAADARAPMPAGASKI